MNIRNFALIICIHLLLLVTIDCNAQHKPLTLKGCLRYMDKVIDDTIKYDFKVSPYGYCFGKYGFDAGFRNSMGLWKKWNPLSLHFRLRGIRHPDDMSSIIQLSYYRYLNNEPIKFRKQKKICQTERSEIRKGRNYNEVSDELRKKNATPDSVLKTEYLKLFYPGRKVKGYFIIVGDIKKWENGMSFRDEQIHYVAVVTNVYGTQIELSILEVGQIEEGFEISDQYFKETPKYGEIVMVDACSLYLIPDDK